MRLRTCALVGITHDTGGGISYQRDVICIRCGFTLEPFLFRSRRAGVAPGLGKTASRKVNRRSPMIGRGGGAKEATSDQLACLALGKLNWPVFSATFQVPCFLCSAPNGGAAFLSIPSPTRGSFRTRCKKREFGCKDESASILPLCGAVFGSQISCEVARLRWHVRNDAVIQR